MGIGDLMGRRLEMIKQKGNLLNNPEYRSTKEALNFHGADKADGKLDRIYSPRKGESTMNIGPKEYADSVFGDNKGLKNKFQEKLGPLYEKDPKKAELNNLKYQIEIRKTDAQVEQIEKMEKSMDKTINESIKRTGNWSS